MALFRRLTIASTIATLLLVSIGGLVSATKSGLGCGTDWPRCMGRLTPALADRAMAIEFAHRAAAGAVLVLVGVTAGIAVWRLGEHRRIKRTAVGAFGLVAWQALLGAIVVKLELAAVSVVLHLATALALLAVLVYLSRLAGALGPGNGSDRASATRTMAAAGYVAILLLVGSYVSGVGEQQNAGFPPWPWMSGRLVPEFGFTITTLHWLHRVLAAVGALVVWGTAFSILRRTTRGTAPARFLHAAAGLYAIEVAIGAASVWTQSSQALNAAFVTAHLTVGALIWSSLVAAAVTLQPAARAAEGRPAAGHGRAAMLQGRA